MTMIPLTMRVSSEMAPVQISLVFVLVEVMVWMAAFVLISGMSLLVRLSIFVPISWIIDLISLMSSLTSPLSLSNSICVTQCGMLPFVFDVHSLVLSSSGGVIGWVMLVIGIL